MENVISSNLRIIAVSGNENEGMRCSAGSSGVIFDEAVINTPIRISNKPPI